MAQENGTTVYEEDFSDDPNYTVNISSNVQNESEVFWDEGPDNFFVKARNQQSDAWHAVGISPSFTTVQPTDGFSVSFKFNPVTLGDDRDPGIYFVDAEEPSPPDKTRAFEFVIDTENANQQFYLRSSTGDQFLTPQIPAQNEQYEATITYYPASQTVDLEVLRQDGSTFVDQRRVSMSISNAFNQVMIGEIESAQSADQFSGTTTIRLDDFQIQTNETEPLAPENPLASTSDGQAELSWLASTASDVAGYNVYRAVQPFEEVAQATKVNSSLLSDTSFTNTGLSVGTTYYYRMTTVDGDGNESEPSTLVAATPVSGKAIVHSEDFSDDPGYTAAYTGNVQVESKVSWDGGPDNFFVKARNSQTYAAWHAVGISPSFPTVQPADGFTVSFQFNPVRLEDDRDPGLYFVDDEASSPPDKTRAFEFVIDTEDANQQFRLTSSTGDQFLSPQIPAQNEQYEVTVTYYPASQTVDLEILRQDGSTFVDQRRTSMEIPNAFNQVMIGEIESAESAYPYSGFDKIRIDNLQIHTNNTQPLAPENLLASASDGQALLSWLASAAEDVAGYNVYRSTQPFDEIAQATKANPTLLSGDNFTDTGLSNGTTYYYRTTTVDNEGNESGPSVLTTAMPLAGKTTVHSEDFSDDPGYTAAYTGNVQVESKVSWDGGPDNFFVKARNSQTYAAWHAVGISPSFPTVQPADGFTVSFQFNPVRLEDDRDPGIYFVDAGEPSPPDKTRSFEFVIDTEDANQQFRLSSSTGDQFLSPQIPAQNERYEVTITYYSGDQRVNLEILRQDGSPLVDNQEISMEISNFFSQVMIGEIESAQSADQFSGTTQIRIDGIRVRSNASLPSAPSGLSAQASHEQVTVSWADTTNPDLDEYWLYRGTTEEFDTSGARIAAVGQNTTQYEDTNVSNGTTYFYRVLATNQNGFIGELSPEVSATPVENLVASVSETVSSDGTVDFGATGVDIAFVGVDGSGTVTVEKYSDSPENIDGISESNVSSYRHVITADGDLTFGTNTEVRLDVSTLDGISDATNVTIYKRPEVGSGTFSELSTTYDSDSNELYATTDSFSEFALASNTEPLPVELANFEATRLDNRIRLSWRTASEQNNARFEIQRKTGHSSSWQQVGTREGAGTTTELQRYQFTDENLPFETERFSYRLKQVNTDGTTTLSSSVQVEIGAPEQVELRAPFPNPATGRVTVRYAIPENLEDQRMRLVLYDVLGRRVRTIASGEDPGRNEISHRISRLSTGTYFLRLTAGEKRKTKRFTVIR